MNFFYKFFYTSIAVFNGCIPMIGCNAELIAIDDSVHSLQLYANIRNDDAPSTADPAKSNAQIRQRICAEITNSGFVSSMLGYTPLNNDEMYSTLQDTFVFSLLYSRTSPSEPYEYTNHHRLLDIEFQIVGGIIHIKEFVFVCPYRNSEGNISTFYVSKEYNVGPFGNKLIKRGRFLFWLFFPQYTNSPADCILLAEEPANAIKSKAEVELYYLQTRKYIDRAKNNTIDPLCKLISGQLSDSNNQHQRMCVAITQSSYFRKEISYPNQHPAACEEKEVSFRTTKANEEVTGKSYYELMTPCSSTLIDPYEKERILYISRAYLSNQVFVYRHDSDGKIYLENLSTNISVVDELNSFDFVEN